jgi:hypothetical protein
MGNGIERQMPVRTLVNKWKPIDKISDQEDNKRSPQDLANDLRLSHRLPFFQRKRKSISDCKQKRREYQVRGRKSMPFGMLELRKGDLVTDLRIDDDHKTNGHPAENVEGKGAIRGNRSIGTHKQIIEVRNIAKIIKSLQ